jgi:hypothetical protein
MAFAGVHKFEIAIELHAEVGILRPSEKGAGRRVGLRPERFRVDCESLIASLKLPICARTELSEAVAGARQWRWTAQIARRPIPKEHKQIEEQRDDVRDFWLVARIERVYLHKFCMVLRYFSQLASESALHREPK